MRLPAPGYIMIAAGGPNLLAGTAAAYGCARIRRSTLQPCSTCVDLLTGAGRAPLSARAGSRGARGAARTYYKTRPAACTRVAYMAYYQPESRRSSPHVLQRDHSPLPTGGRSWGSSIRGGPRLPSPERRVIRRRRALSPPSDQLSPIRYQLRANLRPVQVQHILCSCPPPPHTHTHRHAFPCDPCLGGRGGWRTY